MFIGALIALVLCGLFIYVVRTFLDMLGQEFMVLSLVVTLCLCGLVIVASVSAGRWMIAKANRAVNHERLIVHQGSSFYLSEGNGIYHTGAIQESAKISAYALSLDQSQQDMNRAKEQTPNDRAEDAMSQKVQNLISQGESERAIADHLGIKRNQVRKLKEGIG